MMFAGQSQKKRILDDVITHCYKLLQMENQL